MSQEPAAPFSLEQALERLEAIVERLQRDDVPLAEAVKLFEEGTALTARCDDLLDRAELRIQTLTQAVRERLAGYEAQSSPANGESQLP
ncbi:MAG TPA: exodeoxyribonuclease VII small subunit [Chloroflexota bacterium]|nr:exodeoxyribonuclease VII small subunit [Chloroflexota bacterium]